MTSLVIEFVRPAGQLVRAIDAGLEFIDSTGIPLSNAERPLRITSGTHPTVAIPLPDGHQTAIQVLGRNVPIAGKPLAVTAQVILAGVHYELTVNVTSQLKAIHKTPLQPSPEPPSTQSMKCPRCGNELRVVRFKVGAGFNEFLGCSLYPQCKYTRSLNAR